MIVRWSFDARLGLVSCRLAVVAAVGPISVFAYSLISEGVLYFVLFGCTKSMQVFTSSESLHLSGTSHAAGISIHRLLHSYAYV